MIRDLLHTVATYAAVGSSAIVGPIVVVLSPGQPQRADPVIRFWCNAVLGAAASAVVRLIAVDVAGRSAAIALV